MEISGSEVFMGPSKGPPGGDFLMSGIWVCATDQGQFVTSKNPEQAPNLELFSRTGPHF